MRPDRQPQGPPPYLHVWFNEIGKLIVDMISFILGFKTSEFVDETTLVFAVHIYSRTTPYCQVRLCNFYYQQNQ